MNDLPDEYEKIFTFDNFIRSQKRSLKKIFFCERVLVLEKLAPSSLA